MNTLYPMKIYLILPIAIFGFCFLPHAGQAQHAIDEVLQAIEQNNPALQARRQYAEAQSLDYRTNIYLPNPTVAFEYLPGTPAEAGTQKDLTIAQNFEFPTAYFRKKQVAEAQIHQLPYALDSFRQEILLEAKQLCLNLIYQHKKQALLSQRLGNIERLVQAYERRLTEGNANVLEVNKAKLLRLNLKNDLTLTESQIAQQTEQLTTLNGGETIILSDITYPVIASIPELEVLEPQAEAQDPVLQYVEQQQQISDRQLSLSRSIVLPSWQVGYRYQAILGQQYNGFLAGISIPLWEDKNKVKLAQAHIDWSKQVIKREKIEHLYSIRRLYEKQATLENTLAEFGELLEGLNNTAFLEKALRLGEISSIEFFMEVTYFYEAEDQYLSLEEDYHQTVAELLKYQL
ncbi:MAG: TolC family protein [Cyclobacteriaceae bacterium]